jgi:hypothetical protein
VATTPEARRAEVIKALLLTGAVKPSGWSSQVDRPLDRHFGAGRVRVDRSHAILAAGRAQPRASVDGEDGAASDTSTAGASAGWDFRSPSAGDELVYELVVPDAGMELTVSAVWHRRVAGNVSREAGTGRPRWNDFSRVADFDLLLEHAVEDGTWVAAGASRSRVDNVEHIHLPTAEAGRYRLTVSRRDRHADAWGVAVAWLAAPEAGQAADAPEVDDAGEADEADEAPEVDEAADAGAAAVDGDE